MAPVFTDEQIRQSIIRTYEWICGGCFHIQRDNNESRLEQKVRRHLEECPNDWFPYHYDDDE